MIPLPYPDSADEEAWQKWRADPFGDGTRVPRPEVEVFFEMSIDTGAATQDIPPEDFDRCSVSDDTWESREQKYLESIQRRVNEIMEPMPSVGLFQWETYEAGSYPMPEGEQAAKYMKDLIQKLYGDDAV